MLLLQHPRELRTCPPAFSKLPAGEIHGSLHGCGGRLPALTAAPDINGPALAVLFAPAGRWGWGFRPPPRPALSPERDEPPAYQAGEELAVTWRRWRQRIEAYEGE